MTNKRKTPDNSATNRPAKKAKPDTKPFNKTKPKAPKPSAGTTNAGSKKKEQAGATAKLHRPKTFKKDTGKPTKDAPPPSKSGSVSAMVTEVKALWETARQLKTTPEERKELIKQCLQRLKGNVKDVVFKHDATRVVQTCLKHGQPEDRKFIFEELSGKFEELCMSRYGKFLATKMLKYGTIAQRNEIIEKFYGSVRKYVRHKEASQVVEYAYNDVANETQRANLVQELYAPDFRHMAFKVKNKHNFEAVLVCTPTLRRETALAYMRDLLNLVMGKSLTTHTIVQKVLLEYMQHASLSDVKDVVTLLIPDLVRILHTRDGSRIAVRGITHATVKDRKTVIKSLVGVVPDACKADYGWQVIIRILDVVDDTVLVSKTVLQEIINALPSLATDANGSKPILFLLAPNCKTHFSPQLMAELRKQTGDEVVSKKDPAVRRRELLAYLAPPLLEYLVNNVARLIASRYGTQIVSTLLLYTSQEECGAKYDELIESLLAACKGEGELGGNAQSLNDSDEGPDENDEKDENEDSDMEDEDEDEGTENQKQKSNGSKKSQTKLKLKSGKYHKEEDDEEEQEAEIGNLFDHPIAHRTLRTLVTVPTEKHAAEGAHEVVDSSGRSFAALLWEAIQGRVDEIFPTRGVFILISLVQHPQIGSEVAQTLDALRKGISNQVLLQEVDKVIGS